MIEIYSDGSCSQLNNSGRGPGGWAAILLDDSSSQVEVEELAGGVHHTTNNRMELTGAIRGLQYLDTPQEVRLYTDSAYLCNCINQGWYKKWQTNGWQTSGKKPVENQDLWTTLLSLLEKHKVTFVKVKGHADNKWNNRCDELAVAQTELHKK
jgi:ribonuclease HI